MERVSFWSDEWAGDGLLSLLFARLFRVALDKEVSVKDCYVWVGDKVSCVVRFRTALHPFESLWSLLSNVFIRRNEADSRVWKPKPSDSFSSKSFYKAMESTVLVHSSCSQVWLGIVPPRVKAFCWLAVTCKISMADNLRRRGFSSEAFSTMCYFLWERGGIN